MEGKGFKLGILCCNYTNLAEKEDFQEILGEILMKRYPCSGHIEITDILRTFREGAEAVLVAGCQKGTCHNENGSSRAEHQVEGAQKIIEEIGFPKEFLKFVYVERLNTGDFIEKVKGFYKEVLNKILKEKSV